MKKNTAHWVELARYDWRVVHHMYKSRSYPYVIFMCHLTIEKLFKACISEFTDMIPPKIHDLNKLAEKGQVTIPDEYASFISKLSQQSVATRFPKT